MLTSFTLGQKWASKCHFGAMFVRTFFNCCVFFGHQLFRPIPALHFWETVGWVKGNAREPEKEDFSFVKLVQ